MQGERKLLESDTGEFTLTTHKVRFVHQTRGRAKVTSIMLEHLTACEITYSSRPSLLYFAGAAFMLGILGAMSTDEAGGAVIGIIVALVLVVAYFAQRHQVISLSSPSSSIRLKTSGMSFQDSLDLLEKVEAAKDERARQLLPSSRSSSTLR